MYVSDKAQIYKEYKNIIFHMKHVKIFDFTWV